MRVRGGTAGILAAIASGRLDELDAQIVERPIAKHLTPTNFAKVKRRDARRARQREKRLAARAPF